MLLLTIATQSCLAWILGPGDRGSFAICQIFSVTLNLLFVMGLDVSSQYFVSSKKCSLSEGVSCILVYGGVSSLLAIIAGCAAMQLDFAFFNKAEQLSFFLALLTILPTLLVAALILLLTAMNQFRWFSILSVADGVFLLLFTFLFVVVGRSGVNGALTAVIIQGLLSTIFILLFLRKRYGIQFVKPSVRILRELFHYGIKYHIGKASNYANIHMGTMVAAYFLTKEEVAFFAVASQIMIRAGIIPDTLMTVMLPKVASTKDGMKRAIAQLARLTGVTSIISLALLALLAKPIVIIIFSPAFSPAIPIIQILAIGIAIRCTGKIFEPYLLGVGHPGTVSVSSAVTLIANFILASLFLSMLGLKGVAIGTTLAYCLGASVLLLGFMKYSSFNYGDIWKFKKTDLYFIFQRLKYK
jgi:O-antigen/teichoic acid export membrane protein